jgi:hypothetical protein
MPRCADVPRAASAPAAPLPLLGEVRDDDLQACDTLEVTNVGGRDTPTAGDRSGGDQAVMRTDVATRRHQLSPQARVCPGAEQVEREGRKRQEHRFNKRVPSGAMLGTCTMHAMQQLRCRDGRDTDVLVITDFASKARPDLGHGPVSGKAAQLALKLNEDRSV